MVDESVDESIEYFESFLSYDPLSGYFTWLDDRNNNLLGKIAGHLGMEGYWIIKFNGKNFKSHRLAWLFVFGSWPLDLITHINGDRADNRIGNLKVVSRKETTKNTSLYKNNKGGNIGIHYAKKAGKYIARISLNSKRIPLGSFENINDAIAARKMAQEKYGYHPDHGRGAY